MRFSRYAWVISALGLVILATGSQRLLAQAVRPVTPTEPSHDPIPKTNPKAPQKEPCWQQAGISKTAMEERRRIQESTRAQIEAVCAQTDLTDKEKREKIHEIREAAQQKMASLITPQQEEELKSCQKARAGNSTPHPHASGGPCAQLGH